ncbi:glycosyltransferase [Micromonospora humi]|uniref:Glycosyltransferase involved in cell wall bisynthesis n=1 Tax=Micromonospora humi TaxID=745366 RepID=A0A1C5K7A9_9ACTN|nr:glycosyltransferase [Micromonospora humi]SCG78665.1 Glycosyltransferase involved in cell wall bisynthesis [Micromonospora humi]
MALRVCVLLKTNQGGLWIVPQVEEFRRRGHHVTVVLPPGPGRLTSELRDRDVAVVESPFDFRFRPGPATAIGLWRLRRLLRQLRPDVLHYHLYASALAVRLAALGTTPTRVHMVPGPLFLESPAIRPVERLLWTLDDLVICCTQHVSQLYGELGCPPSRRPVAQYGIDIGHFKPTGEVNAPAKARAELGLPEDAFVVLMVGYVYPPKRLAYRGRGIKGHDTLLSAWARFRSQHPDARLLIVGAGFDRAGADYRQRLMDRFRVAEDASVTWLDRVPDLRPYYTAANLNVTPSLTEGSNGVVREASAMGLPSIVSDAGGLPEAVDASTGWIVPRGDAGALAEALTAAHREFTTRRLSERGARARDRAHREFDERAAAAVVADLVQEAAGRRPARKTPKVGRHQHLERAR